MTRASDDAIWASFATTLRDVVLPTVDDDWVRQSVVQLIGLAEYARHRRDDDGPRRRRQLAEALEGLTDNPLVTWPPAEHGPRAETDAAASALAAAIGRDDPPAHAVREALRPILLAGLDADLAATEVLEAPFRGRLPDA